MNGTWRSGQRTVNGMTTAAARWRPQREVEIVAGTPPGGGLDRTARALARAIESERLLDVPLKVVNIAVDGARKAWAYVERRAGDPHVLAISSPNLATDHLVGLAAFDHSAFTPLAILYNEYLAFIAAAVSPIQSARDLLQRFAAPASEVRVAFSTALGNPNHIALAKVIRHAGGDVTRPKIRVFDSALDALADALAGNAEVAAVTAASAVDALNAGTARALAISAPSRLASPYEATPTWKEQAVDCVIGAWRGITGPHGLSAEQVAYWEKILRAAVASVAWSAELRRHHWTAMYLDGPELAAHLQREEGEMSAVLRELGLLRG